MKEPTVKQLWPDTEYSVVVKGCENLGKYYTPSNLVIIWTVKPHRYVLNPTRAELRFITLSWSSSHENRNTEFRVSVNSSSTVTCTTVVFVGEHSCEIKGRLPSKKYNVQFFQCQKTTNVCEELCNLLVQTASDERMNDILNDLARNVDQSAEEPADPTTQLMLRVTYSKLGVPTIGILKDVSAVITPVDLGNSSEGPNWSSQLRRLAESSNITQLLGGNDLEANVNLIVVFVVLTNVIVVLIVIIVVLVITQRYRKTHALESTEEQWKWKDVHGVKVYLHIFVPDLLIFDLPQSNLVHFSCFISPIRL
ncbi:unnamed protein product [Schistocephalus solidus]|uniref:Fibronectin type-III domain-containing protein n=1 Tax=Schistocephalus solidus TaxID=70667 RepID=A0A183T3I7_SCHSO|nr:unnamed protein product [Schistocephalus solidus]